MSNEIAEIARGLGLDIVSSHEAGRDPLSDEEQLRLATTDGRCLVTANPNDFMRLTDQFFAQQEPHAGVLIIPSTWNTDRFTRIARALRSATERYEGGSTSYLFDFLR